MRECKIHNRRQPLMSCLLFCSMLSIPTSLLAQSITVDAQHGKGGNFVVAVSVSNSVNRKDQKVTIKCENEKLTDVLKKIERQSDYMVIFSYSELQSYKVSMEAKDVTALDAVKRAIAGLGLTCSMDGKYIYVSQVKKGTAPTTKVVRGRVVDENNDPLPGVSIRVKNNPAVGTTSDLDGRFTLPVSEEGKVAAVFSFIGKKTTDYTLSGNEVCLVRMDDNTHVMDEVVVTGYQVMDKRLMSSATSTVKMQDIKIPNVNSLDKMLQGTIPGLMVQNTSGSPNATPRIRMRGSSTIYGNAAPLWVVDGIIYEDPVELSNDELNNVLSGLNTDMVNQMNSSSSRALLGNAISGVNPNDIESITFLKDASATAIYGTRAANGVIVVTTKQGRVGKPSVSFSGSWGFTDRPRYSKYNLMNSKERVGISKEIAENGYLYNSMPHSVGFEGALFDYYNKKLTLDEFNDRVAYYETINTDWFKLLCQNALSQDYSASLSGGTDVMNYYVSVGYNDSKGTTKGDNATMYSMNASLNSKLSKAVRLTVKLAFSERSADGFYTTNPYSYALNTSRAIGADEYYTTQINTIQGLSSNHALTYNIFNELKHTGNEAKSRTVNASLGANITLTRDLKADLLFGVNYANSVSNSWADERSYYIAEIRGYDYGTVTPNSDDEKASRLPHGGILNYDATNNATYTGRAQLTYSKIFGPNQEHVVNVMGGYEARSNQYEGFSDVEWGYYPDRGLNISYEYDTNTSGQSDPNGKNSSLDKHSVKRSSTKENTISAYATFVYSLKSRYIFNANVRGDASNRFGQYTNHKFLPVWSVSGRWKVNGESWFRKWTFIDDFSLRASYGEQGNIPTTVGPNLVAKYINPTVNRFSGNFQLGISRLPYPNLRWEKTRTINLGVDWSFLGGRIAGTVDYYIRQGSDLIFNLPVASEYGTSTTYRNGASMRNTGIEVGLTFIPIQTKDFSWTISPIYSKNTNNISNASKQEYTYQNYLEGNAYENGRPVNAVYAWEFTGLDHETGRATFKYASYKKDEVVKSDDPKTYLKYMGSRDPKFNGGITTAIRYKEWALNAQFAYSFGSVRRLNFLFTGENTVPEPQQNLTTDFLHAWRKPGDEAYTNLPGFNYDGTTNYNIYVPVKNAEILNSYNMYNYSDVRVVSGDFFRCRNIQLSYTFPMKLITPWRITGLSCSLNVSNPFTIASPKLNGQDPEIDSTGSVALPITRNYSFSLNLTF